MRTTGITARGIITPIFKEGDNLVEEITKSICQAAQAEGFAIQDRDIVGVTEAVVARTQGNYATCAQIAADIRAKFGSGTVGLVFPILSRNRFAILLKAIAQAVDELIIQFSYPSDEVGNAFLSWDTLDEKGVDPYRDNFTLEEFRAKFGQDTQHKFTGIDYIEYYRSFGQNIKIVFSNNPAYILNYTKKVLNCDIHTRKRTKSLLKQQGAELVFGLDDILTAPREGSGYNEYYGILGSNKATEDKVKLFPRQTQEFVNELQNSILQATGHKVEVLVYGDGCFKDPVGGIWELADPVVSPAHTEGLKGTPNELKMKYFADNELSELTGEALAAAMKDKIKAKDQNLVGNMDSQGTTPRQITDLVGSLCDLVTGSGDRGTPVVFIKGYFTNYASE